MRDLQKDLDWLNADCDKGMVLDVAIRNTELAIKAEALNRELVEGFDEALFLLRGCMDSLFRSTGESHQEWESRFRGWVELVERAEEGLG